MADKPLSPPVRANTGTNGIIFVHSLLDDFGLSPAQFRVYAHISRRAWSGEAFSAIENIARVCRLHPQTVRRALGVLVKHRLLTRRDRPGDTSVYRVTPASSWQPLTHINADPSETDAPPSVSQGTPKKRIQEQPSETDGVKGNPFEGNPSKEVQTQLPHELPSSEDEAAEEAQAVGVPADFARQEFNRMVSVGWLDGCKRAVRSWPHYIKQRWSKEQSERGERRATNRAPAKRPPPPRQFHSGDYNQPV